MVEALAAEMERLRESLGPLPAPVMEFPLGVVSGLSGSGKSFFSRQQLNRLSAFWVESDAPWKMLFPQPAYTAERPPLKW